ncbi:hypothetical protein [Novosphingobium aquimarinum]|uniref:hypothetical protein n=1 Tax=Novosphingobium aquimarinum TaxID=2682494 RepID=UPI0012EBB36E|nr:hypothetical protein [Novosphingobium aquimarinum]
MGDLVLLDRCRRFDGVMRRADLRQQFGNGVRENGGAKLDHGSGGEVLLRAA